MSRKNRAPKREVLADPLYNSKIVTRLINRVMLDGKRGTAATIVYDAFEQIKEATGNDALEVFETAMDNIMPVLEVRARRVGGSNYQVPVEVRPERRTTLGLRWLVNASRARGEHHYYFPPVGQKWYGQSFRWPQNPGLICPRSYAWLRSKNPNNGP